MKMNKTIVLFVLFLFCYHPVHAETWIWQKACIPNEQTNCEVWFNDLVPFNKISARVKDVSLATVYKGYTKLESPSAAFLLVQTNDLNAGQLKSVKDGLIQLVKANSEAQQIALYHSGETLSPVTILGGSPNELTKGINSIEKTAKPQQAERDLVEILKITGGSPVDRKVVFWVTSGVTLNNTQINQIKTHLHSEKVRLVIVHLTLSELAINTAATLQKLSQESDAIFLSIKPENLKKHAGALAGYTNNGGSLVVSTENFCNTVKIDFQATASGQESALKKSLEVSYHPCPEEVPAEHALPVVVATDDPDDPFPPMNTAGEKPVDPTGESTDFTLPTPSTSDKSPMVAEPLPSSSRITGIVVASLAGGGICALIALVFFLKNKSKNNNEHRCFGFLTTLDTEMSSRYDLKSSGSKIGRSHQNDIVLDDEAVSAHHAVIKMERDGLVNIIDLNSSNGIIVNGEEIEKQIVLNSDDIIEIGESRFRVSFL